ncbi:hypothetical protein G6F57_009109 [Rhizopus arrhizus]|uniref:AAA+ ATPase domain-containing protein n=1 Tax=Rhizopus oryzae TaxID=64495 RepID=A0A9P7BPV1_RHIOR|nr:hypothetical protein G6F23_004708 [Rhizopus arrhizus]KAG1412203.1 hypothetical protein G6F58_008143 [Rhizopus delemar]KAG0759826.1 hypothetical protein G6F24_008784 [Rhizopus arrhizus]KAG0785763.1 hypothetical protein G6F21_009043 [Rhizopus arrhizus]KAG0800100.1 hypothetical protein G6F22_002570 [Rhizopus arrhizus]
MNSNAGPRFLLPSYSTQRKAPTLANFATDFQIADRTKLWTDLYSPKLENDIAVRPARVKEVKMAIDNSSIGHQKGPTKILFLTGPSGCGKSTLIRLVCQSMNYQIIEWIHSTPMSDDGFNSVSNMTRFEQFLNQSIRTSALNDDTCSKKVILVDDIPDLTTDSVKAQFHSILHACAEISLPFLIVFITSDSWTISTTHQKNYDTRLTSIRDLIPSELSDDRRIHTIDEMIGVSKDKLDEIVELSHGDLRSAINMLQFYSTPSRTNDRKRKRDGISTLFDKVTGPLPLFHAAGKVLYAKRDLEGNYESKPEDIINRLPVDNDMFISYLHENCLMFQSDIEECAKSFEYMSTADIIRTKQDWQNYTPSDYRCLLSMHGIMATRKNKVGGVLRQMNKPLFFNTHYPVQKTKDEGNYTSILHTTNNITNEEEMDTIQDDVIEEFSEDEFDDIYGDGTELEEMLNSLQSTIDGKTIS